MTYRMAILASLIVVAAAPCDAQAPASGATAQSAPSSAPSSSSTASSSATAPPAAAAGKDAAAAGVKPAGSTTDAASTEPSPDVLKEARREGLRPKKRDGVTKFCITDRSIGTKFETEKCYDQAQLEMLVQQRQDQRNVMQQQTACTGSSCNGR